MVYGIRCIGPGPSYLVLEVHGPRTVFRRSPLYTVFRRSPLYRPYVNRIYRRSPQYRPYVNRKYRTRSEAREALFTGFYRDNVWKDSESRSGGGSNVNVTEGLRAELPALLHDLGTTTLLDVPCGDFCWMSTLDLGDINYVGADIVSEMIAELQREYGTLQRRFVRLDAICEPLPAADTVLMRDLLQHLPNAHVLATLRNIAQAPSVRWLLVSNYETVTKNPDIMMGQHRFQNLQLPPFGLPAPERVVSERSPQRADKVLAVWPREALLRVRKLSQTQSP